MKKLDIAIQAIAVCLAVYMLSYTQLIFEAPIRHQNTFLLFSLVLVYLMVIRDKKLPRPVVVSLLVLSLVATGYVGIFYDDLELRMGIPNDTDIVIGIILLVVTFAASWKAFGPALPIIALCFIAYAFFGHYLPQPFWHFRVHPTTVISLYNIGLTGMYGLALGVAANYLFLFMLFGALLSVSGANQFFVQLGIWIGKRLPSGAAMTAVVSSAFVGTISGSGMANVAITGPFTIPLMKKAGYKSEQAGAIEAVASTGGSIMPPIMGIVAFVMAEFTGTPYVQVIAMAIIPAVLYYISVGVYVHLNALKMRVKPLEEKVDMHAMRLGAPLFIVPLGVIIAFLVRGYSPMFAATYGLFTLIPLAMLRKETRESLEKWVKGCVTGGTMAAKIGVSAGIVGVIIATVTMTGIGVRFPAMVDAISGGYFWSSIILVALMTIILGCALPPFASYLLVAMLCVPVITAFGVNLMQANFFVYFFAVFALITPPIALSCLVAAPIADAGYLRIGLESVKVAIGGWLLPFIVLFFPGMLLMPDSPLTMVTKLLSSIILILFAQVFINNYWYGTLNIVGRILAIVCVSSLLAFITTTNYIFMVLGILVAVAITGWQLRRRRYRTLESSI